MDPSLLRLVEAGDGEDEVAAIVRLGQPGTAPEGVRLVTRFGDIATVRLRRGAIPDVRASAEVASMKPPWLLVPEPTVASEGPPGPLTSSDERRPSDGSATGRGVVLGVIDFGCDFAHPDFRRPDGRTRLLTLWDQSARPASGASNRYGYGEIHDSGEIDRALETDDPYAALGYHPAASDPVQEGAHGTHVMSIAAGNGRGGGPVGVAPEADLVFVQHSSRFVRRGTHRLGDSVTLLEAVDFVARTAGERPWVINISMGSHGGQHDGSTLVEQGLDAALRAAPGRGMSQSAGNYYQQRCHTSGRLREGEEQTFAWEIDAADVTANELEVWYSGRDAFVVELRSPSGDLAGRAELGERVSLVLGGREVGEMHHRQYEPNSLDNHVDVFLYPGAPAGGWRVTLIAQEVVDGRFHAWIERDAICEGCQSRFPPQNAVPSSTTGAIANGFRAISVGAYDPHSPGHEVAPFSSCGPTRDGRQKPDVVAPGVEILAARSASYEGHDDTSLLTRMSGTSMASPHVAGTLALMFEVAPRPLRSEETHNLLTASAREAPGEAAVRFGSGYLDLDKAIEAARRVEDPQQAPTRALDRIEEGEPAVDEILEGTPEVEERAVAELAELEEQSAPACYTILSATSGTLPAIGFELDLNYGASKVSPPLKQGDAGFNAAVYGLEGKNITTHRMSADGFRLEGDGNRIEIATRPFELSATGKADMKKIVKDVLTLATGLIGECGKAKADTSLGFPAAVGAPRYFKPGYLESPVKCVFPLALNPKKSYYGDGCAMGASPQATFTLPLGRVDALVTLIKNSEGERVAGRALSGPAGWRQGKRSQALYDAQAAVKKSRDHHIKAKTKLTNGDTVTGANFTPALQGLLILMVSYLRTSELTYDHTPNGDWDYEIFAKAYLPLNVKNPFRLLYADLTADEKRVFKDLYDSPRVNLWKLAKDSAAASDKNNQLFPARVKGHLECWFSTAPTWDEFVEKTVTNTPLKRDKHCPGADKKGEDVGCEVLFAPLSRVLPYESGSRRVTIEMRRLGFNWVLSHGFEKDGVRHPGWSEMTGMLFDMALKLNKPEVASVSPNKGPIKGGQAITIHGTGFLAGTTVKIGGAAATDVVVKDTNTLTAKTPAGTAGRSTDVVVTTPAGSARLPGGYAYEAAASKPRAELVDPASAADVREATATPVNIHLKFEVWSEARRAFESLGPDVDVSVMEYDPVSSDDVLDTRKTDADGRVSFSFPDLRAKAGEEPDIYFLVHTNGRDDIANHTLPQQWSTKGWKDKNNKPGYYENFKGGGLGTPADPLTFYIGLDFHLKLEYRHKNGADVAAPKGIPVSVGTAPGARWKKKLRTDGAGEVHGVIFDIDPGDDVHFHVDFEIEDKEINLPRTRVQMDQAGWSTFWDDADKSYFPDNDRTSIGSQARPHVLRCTLNDRNVALYWLKIVRELSTFLFHMTGGEWKGVDDLILYRTSASGAPYSWPVGSVNIPPSTPSGFIYHWDRSTVVHELSHQVMWKEANFTSGQVAGEWAYGQYHGHHDYHQRLNGEHALIDGWAEFMEAVFEGRRTPPYAVSPSDVVSRRVRYPDGSELLLDGTGARLLVDKDQRPVPGGLGPPPPDNRGEEVEGVFANGLWAIFEKHVVTPGVASNAHVHEDPANLGQDVTRTAPWILKSDVRDRFRSMIWEPLRQLKAIQPDPTTAHMIANIKRNNLPVWHKLQPELQAFNMAMVRPTVKSILPNKGPTKGGQGVAIYGAEFVPGATVTIGRTPAADVVVIDTNSLMARTPPGIAARPAADVAVTTPAGSGELPGGYIYRLPPTITSVSPSKGPLKGDQGIAVYGTGFVPGTTVIIGGVPATDVVVIDANSLMARTPPRAAGGSVDVVVTTLDDSATLASGYTYEATRRRPRGASPAELVDLADTAVGAGHGPRAPGDLIGEVISRTAAIETNGHDFPSAAEIFDAFAYPGRGPRDGLRGRLERFFEVVAAPGTLLEEPLLPGDLFFRRALAEGDLAHVGMIVNGEVLDARDLGPAGLTPESGSRGLYAQVTELGAFPKDTRDRFARRLAAENRRLGHDQLILRLRPETPDQVDYADTSLPTAELVPTKNGEISRRLESEKKAPGRRRKAAPRPKKAKTLMISEPVAFDSDTGKAENEDMAIYARHALGGAEHRTADSWEKLLKVLLEYESVERLVLYFHGTPGAMIIGGDDRDLDAVATSLFAGQKLPKVTGELVFEGCSIAENAGKIVPFAKLFSAPKVTAWNHFHVNAVLEVRVKRGNTAKDVEKALADYADYLIPNSPNAAELARTSGTKKLVIEWFRIDYSEDPLPPPDLLDSRSKTFKRRSTATDVKVTEAEAKGLKVAPARSLERITVEISYPAEPARESADPTPATAAPVLPDSTVADRFVEAHRSRWCRPGDRGSATCRSLTAPRSITRIVIHALGVASTSTRSGAEAVIRGWQRSGREASAHYIIDRDGTTTQMVREGDVAYHVVGNNRDTIGIEHADVCNDPAPYTTALYERSAALVRDVAGRHGIALVVHGIDTTDVARATVVGHAAVGDHGDPGPYWDWEYYSMLLRWDGTPATRPVRAVAMAADQATAPAGWTVRRRRRIPNSHCANRNDPYGARYWRAPKSPTGAPAEFAFAVTEPGVYKVSLWWPKASGANAETPVEVEVGSSVTTFKVNQRKGSGRWNDVARVLVTGRDPVAVYVRVRRDSARDVYVLADAVRLLKVEDAGASPPGERPAGERAEMYPSGGRRSGFGPDLGEVWKPPAKGSAQIRVRMCKRDGKTKECVRGACLCDFRYREYEGGTIELRYRGGSVYYFVPRSDGYYEQYDGRGKLLSGEVNLSPIDYGLTELRELEGRLDREGGLSGTLTRTAAEDAVRKMNEVNRDVGAGLSESEVRVVVAVMAVEAAHATFEAVTVNRAKGDKFSAGIWQWGGHSGQLQKLLKRAGETGMVKSLDKLVAMADTDPDLPALEKKLKDDFKSFAGTPDGKRHQLQQARADAHEALDIKALRATSALGDDVFARDLLTSEYAVALFMNVDKNRPIINRLNKKKETALQTGLRVYRQRMLLSNETDLTAYEPWIRFPELWTSKEWGELFGEADFVDVYRERIIFHYGSELGATIDGQERQKGIGRMVKMYPVPLSRDRGSFRRS